MKVKKTYNLCNVSFIVYFYDDVESQERYNFRLVNANQQSANMLSRIMFFIICCISVISCLPSEDSWTTVGLAPLYASPDDMSLIYAQEPIESVKQGLFIEKNGYIYINERFKGIHVIDNTNPASPEKVFFWNIPGNTEFTIDDDILYADNSRHLLVIDISDYSNIAVKSLVKDTYSINMDNVNFPDEYQGRFECVDWEKGIVVGWETKLLENPKCFTIN